MSVASFLSVGFASWSGCAFATHSLPKASEAPATGQSPGLSMSLEFAPGVEAGKSGSANPLSVENGTLCKFCDGLLRDDCSSSDDIWAYHSDWRSIEDSAATCRLCAEFWQIVESPEDDPSLKTGRPPRDHWTRLKFLVDRDHEDLLQAVYVYADWPGLPRWKEDELGYLSIYPLKRIKNARMGPLPSSSDDESVWQLTGEWMRQCTEHHALCRISQPEDWRPTRLLDVNDTGSPAHIRLIEREEIPCNPQYVTLSHCWGSANILRLLTCNAAQLKERIHLSALARTFQDAVKITRQLGVRFLWIDSLCIVQDSAEDWAKESNQMGAIYQFGLCNIAASGAADSLQGCFIPRDPTFNLPHRINDGDEPSVCMRTDKFWKTFQNSPLNLRAWVLQERVLAPRVIHFGLPQIVWECNELLVSERFPHGLSGRKACPEVLLGSKTINALMRNPPPNQDRFAAIEKAWSSLLETYSVAKLTVETDRLVALTGIVEKLAAFLEDEFVAGLWKRNLERQLLWRNIGTISSPARRTRSYVAPSWSWASLSDAHIELEGVSKTGKEIKLCSLQKVVVVPPEHGPKYAVSDGFLEARGHLVPVNLLELGSTELFSRVRVRPQTGKRSVLYCQVSLDTAFDVEHTFWCMPLLMTSGIVKGLLLERIDGEELQFRRCGTFNVWGPPWIRLFWRSCNAFNETQVDSRRFNGAWTYEPNKTERYSDTFDIRTEKDSEDYELDSDSEEEHKEDISIRTDANDKGSSKPPFTSDLDLLGYEETPDDKEAEEEALKYGYRRKNAIIQHTVVIR